MTAFRMVKDASGRVRLDGARPMTRAEALAESRKRWPDGGTAWQRWQTSDHSEPAVKCVGPAYIVRGMGPTWEAAFADADRRAQEGAK